MLFQSMARTTASKRAFISGLNKSGSNSTSTAALQARGMASSANKHIDEAAQKAGEAKNSSPENPSIVSSAGAIGKQFNPEGKVGQIGEKIGGPFSKDGAIGSQFDASKDGLAGKVEKAVDGPRNPASNPKQVKVKTGTSPGTQR